VTSESTANCDAIQAMGFVATRLGADEGEAHAAAAAMAALEPFQGDGYGTNECRAGAALDLHPETPAFPTEDPITAPMGVGGTLR
jgi:hypothetical protein